MTKLSFLLALNEKLAGLPRDEVEERLRFYSEMIEDRMEEGLAEEEAVLAAGSVEQIAAQIVSEFSGGNRQTEIVKPKKDLKVWQTVLLILGSPVWFSLLLAAAAVGISLYIALWAVNVSGWAVFTSFVCCAFSFAAAGIGFICGGDSLTGVAMIGLGLVFGGLSVFLYFGCERATKGTLLIAKKLALGVKRRIGKKEEVQ